MTKKHCYEIYLSFEIENKIAQKLDEQLGFQNIREVIDGELLYCLTVK
ncbi:MAG: hypothetical protein ACI35O_01490 [Bacillaceae bacterium]